MGKAHDVFISYSSKDKQIADAVCNKLESDSIRCWIAPRDIKGGDIYAESISIAIGRTKVFLLVFSSNSNQAKEVLREIQIASNKEVLIIPFKVDNTEPSEGFDYYLNNVHWIDCIDNQMEVKIENLRNKIIEILDIELPQDENEEKYSIGIELIKAKKFNKAKKMFKQLGNYRDSNQQYKDIRKKIAVKIAAIVGIPLAIFVLVILVVGLIYNLKPNIDIADNSEINQIVEVTDEQMELEETSNREDSSFESIEIVDSEKIDNFDNEEEVNAERNLVESDEKIKNSDNYNYSAYSFDTSEVEQEGDVVKIRYSNYKVADEKITAESMVEEYIDNMLVKREYENVYDEDDNIIAEKQINIYEGEVLVNKEYLMYKDDKNEYSSDEYTQIFDKNGNRTITFWSNIEHKGQQFSAEKLEKYYENGEFTNLSYFMYRDFEYGQNADVKVNYYENELIRKVEYKKYEGVSCMADSYSAEYENEKEVKDTWVNIRYKENEITAEKKISIRENGDVIRDEYYNYQNKEKGYISDMLFIEYEDSKTTSETWINCKYDNQNEIIPKIIKSFDGEENLALYQKFDSNNDIIDEIEY